jgi:hypothetical protein
LPNGWRFGWDGILGLIPGIGNLITDGFALYILVRAAMVGCPPSLLLRMGLNVLIDNIIDKVPLFGIVFDFIWKANTKNVALMERYFDNQTPVVRQSRYILILTLVLILVLFISGLVVTFWLLLWLVEIIQPYFSNF